MLKLVQICVFLLGVAAQTAMAGFQLEISQSGPVSAGGSVAVDVYAFTTSGTQLITGFDLKFDLLGLGGTNVGQSLPSGFTMAPIFLTNQFLTLGPGTTLRPDGAGRDFYINGDNNNVNASIGTTKTKLFTMNFDIAGGTTNGVYDFVFVSQASSPSVSDENFDPITLTLTNGSITVGSITAVPEPSSMALVGLCAVGFAVRKRFKKRAPQA